jgi:hypothetical protein
MKVNKYTHEKLDIIIKFAGDITTAEIWDTAGNYARGSAKYHPDDRYSENFGHDLALCRASYRYFKKIEKKLVRSTK